MNSSNSNGQAPADPGHAPNAAASEKKTVAKPVTQDELDAYRFRGAPVRRVVAPAGAQMPPAKSEGRASQVSPDAQDAQTDARRPGKAENTSTHPAESPAMPQEQSKG